MIQYFNFNHNNSTAVPTEAEAAWIHLEKPTEEEITTLSKEYQIPKNYFLAILDNQEVPRYESPHQTDFEKPVLLLLQYPHSIVSPSGFKQYETYPFTIILTSDKIFTASNFPAAFLGKFSELFFTNPDVSLNERLTLQLALHIADTFNQFVASLKVEMDDLESQLRVATENRQLYQLMDIQKSLVYFKVAIGQNISALEAFSKSKLQMISEESHHYLHTSLVEMKQALSSTSIQLQLVSQISDMFSAIVSNNLNIVMKVLTSLTIVITIPTIIGGLYGMNVRLPFSDADNAFWILCGLTALICIITVRILKKRKYF